MSEKYKKILFYSLISVILLAGAVLRILFYSYARPFWNDESAMALNLVNRSFLGLFQPLDYSQLTPPLYSVVCKFFGLFIHVKEYAFRLPALVCGIASLPVFYLLSKKLLQNKISLIFANAVFALNYQLIYYSEELKQYSCDVLLFSAILLSYFYIDFEKVKTKQLLAVSLFYAVCVWFSYAALFSIFVVFVLVLFKKNRNKVFALFGAPAVSFGFLYLLVKRFASDVVLHDFWAEGFVLKNFSNLPKLIHNNMIFYFPDLGAKIILVLLFACGAAVILRQIKSDKSLMIILSISLAFILSYFNIYPMYLRTALYLFPVVVITMAAAFDSQILNKKTALFASAVLIVYMAGCSFKTDMIHIVQKHYYRETTPDIIRMFLQNSKASDKLVVPSLSSINYEYYRRYFQIDNKRVFYMRYPLYEYEDIKTAYDMLPQNSTYYIIVTHSGDKDTELSNLSKYAYTQKLTHIISDEFDNALIRFKK